MNGYEILAQGYKQLVKQGEMTEEQAQPEIRILDFLGECSQDDIYRLVDSSAFNDIIKAYCRKALQSAEVDEKTTDAVMGELRWLFETTNSKEIMK